MNDDRKQTAAPERILRESPLATDTEAVRALVSATGFFSAAEVEIAAELVEEALSKGEAGGYRFLLVELQGALVAYTCYGEIPGTVGSYDLYWIVVAPASQGRGLGRWLLAETEARIDWLGGRRLYAETSSRPQYAATRRFYASTGFREAARLADFYAPGDGKIIYAKSLVAPAGRGSPAPPAGSY
jgi:ribosomal protein S18 acetylase RimI-like enzyme